MSKDIKKSLEHCVEWNCVNCPNRDELGSGETVCRGRLLAEVLEYVSDLEAKLAESESKVAVGRFWHSAYEGKQLDYDKLNDDYNKQEKLLSEILANKSTLQFEFDQLKQQLAERLGCSKAYVSAIINGDKRFTKRIKEQFESQGIKVEGEII